MISIFREGDGSIWVPVAKGKKGGSARAFLPFNGQDGRYTYGYKASPSTGRYLDALRDIQRAFVDDECKTFSVNGGRKEERQWKARWRHGDVTSSPLLGPTIGWVLVPLDKLEKVSGADLGNALVEAKTDFVELSPSYEEPVLCRTPEALERESARLYHEDSLKVPAGQSLPTCQERSTEQYVRDAAVVAYVLRAADGACECCLRPAPFAKPNGMPYLEVHHVKRLASGGSDKVSNAVGVCPNCHRELHHGANSAHLVESLLSRVERLVRE